MYITSEIELCYVIIITQINPSFNLKEGFIYSRIVF